MILCHLHIFRVGLPDGLLYMLEGPTSQCSNRTRFCWNRLFLSARLGLSDASRLVKIQAQLDCRRFVSVTFFRKGEGGIGAFSADYNLAQQLETSGFVSSLVHLVHLS